MQGQQIEDTVTAPMRPIRSVDREEGDDESADGSRPPPEPRGPAPSVAEWAGQKAGEAKATSDRALRIATEARDTGKRIELMMGGSPDPVLGVPGTGLFGGVAAIKADVHQLTTKLDGLVTALTAQQLAADKATLERRGSTARLIGWIAAPSIALAVAGIAAWLAGFHR